MSEKEEYVTINVLLPADVSDWLEETAKKKGLDPSEFLSAIIKEGLDNIEKYEKAIKLFTEAMKLEEQLFKKYDEIMELFDLKSYAELYDLKMKLLVFMSALTPPEDMKKVLKQKQNEVEK